MDKLKLKDKKDEKLEQDILDQVNGSLFGYPKSQVAKEGILILEALIKLYNPLSLIKAGEAVANSRSNDFPDNCRGADVVMSNRYHEIEELLEKEFDYFNFNQEEGFLLKVDKDFFYIPDDHENVFESLLESHGWQNIFKTILLIIKDIKETDKKLIQAYNKIVDNLEDIIHHEYYRPPNRSPKVKDQIRLDIIKLSAMMIKG